VLACGSASAVGTAPAGAAGSNWTVYHHDPGGSGNAGSGLDLSPVHAAWSSPALDGSLYGEPLVLGTSVYVATENDTVYALNAATGTVRWRHHLGTPVPSGDLPCGNIGPTVGITSTPVIDPVRQEIFVVDDELSGGVPTHVLYGLKTAGGAVALRQGVDPPGADPAAILQRASLTLDGGSVVFGYGGNYGDCSTYHGWVASVPEAGGAMATFEVDGGPGEDQGAVWMGGGAPVVDGSGHVWVAAGNGSVTSSSGPYDDSDSVLELSSSLSLLQFFAPLHWYRDNAEDLDLGSAVPAVLSNGLVVQAGKSDTAFLLNGAALGGIGHPLHNRSVCGADVDGGVALAGNTVYLPCEAGVVALKTDPTTDSFSQLWQTPTGSGGPPIVAGGLVWTISGGTLFGLNPANGQAEQQLSISPNATDFPTPSVGDGLLLAPAGDQVDAFAGP
jgi:outer membrane protein assembly factor BamB